MVLCRGLDPGSPSHEPRQQDEGIMTLKPNEKTNSGSLPGPFQYAVEYLVDAGQRTILFWDVLRERGNQYQEHLAKKAPNVLDYKAELVIDGRALDRPVNYVLARIIPPETVSVDPMRRPFVVVDPRAGHGP